MCLPTFTLSETLAIAILVFMGAEIASLAVITGKTVIAPFGENEPIKPEGREYATRATTLGGLTFAAITLLVGTFYQQLDRLSDVFFLLGLSIGLFLISYSAEVLVRIAKLFWIIQDKTLWYGFLSVILALDLFFRQFLSDSFLLILAVVFVVAGIHIYEFYLDVMAQRSLKRAVAAK